MNAPDLRGLFFVDAQRGWAVGTSGTILRYDGTNWVPQTSPVTSPLNDIFMVSATDGWIVGDNGTLLRLRFGVWSSVELPPTMSDSYTAVYMLGSAQGHILGKNNTYLYYQGGAWNRDSNAPDVFGLSAMSFGPDGTGWAASEDGDMLRYGAYWSHRQDVGQAVYSIDMLTDSVGWAAGDGGMHYTDARCTPTSTECWHLDTSRSYAGLILRGVHMLSSTDGWAVGDGGVILHWNGQTWATVREANPANPTLRRVVMVSPWEGWAVGDDGAILHYGGPEYALPPTATPSPTASPTPTATGSASTNLAPGSWTAQTAGSEGLRPVSFPTSSQGWAVGKNGTIRHFDGSRWETGQSVDPSIQLNSVSMISTTLGWAVGDGSVVLRCQNGAWQAYDEGPIPADDYLVVRTVSTGDGWALGAKGTVLRLVRGV